MRGSGGSDKRGRMSEPGSGARNQLVSARAMSMCWLWWRSTTRDQGTWYWIKFNWHLRFDSDKDELCSLTIRGARCLLKMSLLSGWRGGSLLFMSKAGSTFHCFYWLGNQDAAQAEAEVVKGQWLAGWGMWVSLALIIRLSRAVMGRWWLTWI